MSRCKVSSLPALDCKHTVLGPAVGTESILRTSHMPSWPNVLLIDSGLDSNTPQPMILPISRLRLTLRFARTYTYRRSSNQGCDAQTQPSAGLDMKLLE